MRVNRSGALYRVPLLEIVEDLGGIVMDTSGSFGPVAYFTRGSNPDLSTAGVKFYAPGGAAVPSFVTSGGHGVRRFAPGTNQISAANGKWGFPLKRDLSLIPSDVRRQHRIVWETVLKRATPLIAGVKCEIGLKDDPALSMEGPGATVNGGIALSSVSTRNAGAWTLLYILTNGGGLNIGGSSGVVPDGTPQSFRFEYFDQYPNPVLRIWINGAVRFEVSGANLPVLDGNEPLNVTVTSGDTVTNTIGQLDDQYQSRFAIDLL